MSNIQFTANVSKIYTLVDNGIRVTLDLKETDIATAAQLMECKRVGAVIDFEGTATIGEVPKPKRIVSRQ